MTQVLFSFGARSGMEQATPYAEGDRIVTTYGARVLVTHADTDATGQPVLLGVVFGHVPLPGTTPRAIGADVAVTAREILYRSR